MDELNLTQLIQLWKSTMGNPPSPEQFAIWGALHSPEVIRKAIVKTAVRSQTMNGRMEQDHRLRFASKVMMSLTEQYSQNAQNQDRLRQEFTPNSRVLELKSKKG